MGAERSQRTARVVQRSWNYLDLERLDNDREFWLSDLPELWNVLTRVHQDRMREREAYEFFSGLNAAGDPMWSADIHSRAGVFEHAGRCYRSGISYNAALRRYLWCQIIPGKDTRFAGGFGIYDAPEPWGPWTTVAFEEQWDVGPGESSSIPTKWISQDGLRFALVFSGDDHFSVRQATLLLQADQP